MFQDLTLFRMSGAMAQHAGSQQAVIARNVANADTPGFQALQATAFQDSYRAITAGRMQTTRAGHMMGDAFVPSNQTTRLTTEPSPNGNSVSIEDQMFQSVDIAREHARALAIYRHGMTVLRSTLGR